MKRSESITNRPTGLHLRWGFHILVLPALIVMDSILMVLAYLWAYRLYLYLPGSGPLPPESVYFSLVCFLGILTPVVFGFSRVYSSTWRPIFVEFSSIVLGTVLLTGLQFTLLFFFKQWLPYPDFSLSRGVTLLGVFMGITAVTLMHHLARKCLQFGFRRGLGTRKVLIAGDPTLLNYKDHFKLQGIELVGHTDSDFQTIEKRLAATQVDLVLLRHTSLSPMGLFEIHKLVSRQGAGLWLLPDATQLSTARQHLGELAGFPVLMLERTPLHQPWNRFSKRVLDLLISVVALALLWPLFMCLAVMIKVDSQGPVFYVQERISRYGSRFKMLKFRTMVSDSEIDSGPVWARANDPRITRMGRLLRRTSLDELPQLFNVLLGQMSFVGPRPERPHFVNQFEQTVMDYPDRHMIKAGLTGWAQINGYRGDTGIEERTRYDLYYIENWSLLFDLRIIARSFVTVIADYLEKRAY